MNILIRNWCQLSLIVPVNFSWLYKLNVLGEDEEVCIYNKRVLGPQE